MLLLATPLVAQTAATSPATSRPSTYGPSAVSYVRVPAAAFLPVNSSDGYTGAVGGPRYSSGFPTYFQAPVQLPSGAKVVSLELDFVDTNGSIDVLGSLLECDSLLQNCAYHPAAGGGAQDCITAGYVCSGFSSWEVRDLKARICLRTT